MTRQFEFYPQSNDIETAKPFPVCRVWSYLGTEITRVVGKAPFGNGSSKTTATRSIRYPNASKASKARLHKVISKLVNKGQATISLFEGGYEVEL